MSRRRHLSDDERTLWEGVTRSIAPLRARQRTPVSAAVAEAEPARAEPSPPAAARKPAPAAKPLPPLAPLDRRQKQRVARGRDAIDARIDLHGMTLAQAHLALRRFLRRAQADGAKLALVVTGKGARDGAGERGALRREVPLWLGSPDLRAYVVGFEDAHVGHGGEGALYVRVRRGR